MVDGIKSCTEVKKDENVKGARVSRQEEVVNYAKNGSLCAVTWTEARLKMLIQVVVVKKGV